MKIQKKTTTMQTHNNELRKQLTYLIENNTLAKGIQKIAATKLQKIISLKKLSAPQKTIIKSCESDKINCWRDENIYYISINKTLFTFPSPWNENDFEKKFQILVNISETLSINEISIIDQVSSETLLFILLQKLLNNTTTSRNPQIIDDHLIYLNHTQAKKIIRTPTELKAQQISLNIFTLIRAIFRIINSAAPSISFYDLAAVLIKNPHFQAVTFDFFDTISYRTSDDPKDIFISAGISMLERNILPEYISPQRFKNLRAKAESMAREHATNRECTLNEIYQELKNHLPDFDMTQAIEIEVETEIKQAIINKDILYLAQLAQKHNKQVAVISDTYLGKNHLKRILGEDAASLFKHFFTSSEHRSGKTQTLHTIAHKKLGIHANKCLHFGDNYIADVKKAPILGRQLYSCLME